MADKPTPEEQLLRLIEKDKNPSSSLFDAIDQKKTEQPAQSKKKAVSIPLSDRLPFLKLFNFAGVSIKTANKILMLITIVLFVFLIIGITQSQSSLAGEIIKEITGSNPPAIKTDQPPVPGDLFDYMRWWEPRNMLMPVVKEIIEPVIITTTPPTTTQQNPTIVNPPVVMTDPMIEELKKKYKLKGIIKIGGNAKAIIERGEKGEESDVVGIDDSGIKGSLPVVGGELKYSLKVKEIREDTVVLIDENSKKELELQINNE